MREAAASIYLVEDVLLVSIRDDITDTDIIELQDSLSAQIARTSANAVVMDISALEIVDTFVGRVLAQLSGVAKLLDAATFVVGMRPAVAMTLVELGMDLTGARTALSLTHAMRLLRSERSR